MKMHQLKPGMSFASVLGDREGFCLYNDLIVSVVRGLNHVSVAFLRSTRFSPPTVRVFSGHETETAYYFADWNRLE